MLAFCSLCGCLNVFFCLSVSCSELDMDLIVSVSEFTYLLLQLNFFNRTIIVIKFENPKVLVDIRNKFLNINQF